MVGVCLQMGLESAGAISNAFLPVIMTNKLDRVEVIMKRGIIRRNIYVVMKRYFAAVVEVERTWC